MASMTNSTSTTTSHHKRTRRTLSSVSTSDVYSAKEQQRRREQQQQQSQVHHSQHKQLQQLTGAGVDSSAVTPSTRHSCDRLLDLDSHRELPLLPTPPLALLPAPAVSSSAGSTPAQASTTTTDAVGNHGYFHLWRIYPI